VPQDGPRAPGAGAGGAGATRGRFWTRWLLAQGATTSASLVSYPFDTVRQRMMMQSGPGLSPEYRSTWDCWRTILRKEGVPGVLQGTAQQHPARHRAAFVLVMYDELQGRLHKR